MFSASHCYFALLQIPVVVCYSFKVVARLSIALVCAGACANMHVLRIAVPSVVCFTSLENRSPAGTA